MAAVVFAFVLSKVSVDPTTCADFQYGICGHCLCGRPIAFPQTKTGFLGVCGHTAHQSSEPLVVPGYELFGQGAFDHRYRFSDRSHTHHIK